MLLVTGVSGVGKTFTISEAVLFDNSVRRLSGSGILKIIGRPTSSLTTLDANYNQDKIIDFVNELSTDVLVRAIFDGHAAIETIEGAWTVPIDVVRRMKVNGVALIEDSIASISTRRSERGKRSDEAWIRQLCHLERFRSQDIAAALRVPFYSVRSGDATGLLQVLDVANKLQTLADR